ncbi:TonB-dependent receptor [Novosphingobium sp. FSW06-99]|uniref:TonB-dependent receptor n=1 Tax=Novosphingobium sp. FSW06-99 TaxID=1739113 RepID=UPI00076CFFA2|nr:TonB-dependent receptor [Novosphingobium sp. FSW06-99]KUR80569.1 TonB-dependent receptor [Novosphingobium sp. FSW06-99]
MKTGMQMLKFGLFAGSALFALSGTAHADQAADATTAATSSGEIIVTAQRRDQSLQDVPMTLQALSSDSLSKLNVTTFNDLLKYTPNVTFGNNGPGQGAIFMRGLSSGFAGEQSAGTIGGFPNVALYLDDQSMQFPAHNADIYVADIERVEVLEGPQGTLFGGGAEAGAVRYITAKPKLDKFEGKIEGSFGGTSGGAANAAFNAMLNVPIIQDKVAVRAVIYDDHHGGYINNVYSTFTRANTDLGNYYLGTPKNTNGIGYQTVPQSQQSNNGQYNNADQVKNNANPADYVGGRIELAANIAPDWNLLVTESYQSLDTSGSFSTQSYSYDYQPIPSMSSTLFEPQYSKDNYWNTAWTIDGKLGDFKVLYTGAYMVRHISQQGDYTNYARAPYGVYYQCTGGKSYWNHGATPYCYAPNAYWTDNLRTTHQSHELRLTTPEGKRIRAIVGAYYESFKIQDINDWDYKTIPACTTAAITANQACSASVGPLPGATANQGGLRQPATAFGEDTQRGYKQYALFGSVDFDILPTVTLTGGTRYYDYKEYETGSVYETAGYYCNQQPATTNCAVVNPGSANLNADNLNASFKGFKSRGVITWKPQPHTMAYALFSQGFRPGLFNRGPTERVQDPVDPYLPSGAKNYQLAVPAAVKPDTLTNWEVGFKTDLLDRKVQFNLSAYYMVWQNVQTGFFNPAGGFGNTAFGVTGPNYHIKGVEAQIVARPITGLSLQGSATYNDSKQSTSPCFISNIATSSSYGQCISGVYLGGSAHSVSSPFGNIGDTTPFSPHVQANARARYDWAGKADFNWFVSGGVSYTGSQYNQPATYPNGNVADNASTFLSANGIIVPGTTLLRYEMPGYATFDSSVGFTHDNITVTIFGENLGNAHSSTFTSSAEYIKTQVPLRPRIYGVKISSKF